MRPFAYKIWAAMTANPKPITELDLYNKIMGMIMEAVGEILGWSGSAAFAYTDNKISII